MKGKLNTVHTKVTPDLMAATSNGSANLFCFQRSSHGGSSVTVKRKRSTLENFSRKTNDTTRDGGFKRQSLGLWNPER
jgi:hypothetical protein